MTENFKNRVITSVLLLLLLCLIFFNNVIQLYFLLLIPIIAFIEFSKLTQKIFYKKKFLQLISNIFFIVYIFSFAGIFFLSSQIIQLKLLFFLCLILCIASDIGGLLFGKFFKGPKLTKISPKKTISGSIGSFIFSLLIALLCLSFTSFNFDFIQIFLLSILVSTGSQLGDIFFSYLKRKARVKDTGKILPGHGGILDRIDGILIGIPFGLFLTVLLYGIFL